MKRKNFPGRKNERRKVAIENMNQWLIGMKIRLKELIELNKKSSPSYGYEYSIKSMCKKIEDKEKEIENTEAKMLPVLGWKP